MTTKIDFLRDEFERIGCIPPKNPYEPRLYVGWHYTEILVSGFYEDLFDYDILAAILAKVPDGAGEIFFWERVQQTKYRHIVDLGTRQTRLSIVK